MPTWATGFYPARFAPGGGIFSTNLEQDTRTFFVCFFFGYSGKARFLRSRSALASIVSAQGFGVLGGEELSLVCPAFSFVGSGYVGL